MLREQPGPLYQERHRDTAALHNREIKKKKKVAWRNRLFCPIVEFQIGKPRSRIIRRLGQGLTLRGQEGYQKPSWHMSILFF